MTLRAQGLGYRYPDAAHDAIKDVSLTVGEGEILGLLGPSGAGKSTVQKILTRQLSGASGDVWFRDRTLDDYGRRYLEMIGVAFEQPKLYERLSGVANLSLFAGLYDRECVAARSLFKRVGLDGAEEQPVAEYSKGMKHRLALLRAIQHQPEILFLDEPTSGSDPATTERLIEVLRQERARGAAILLTTHDMHVAEALCDRIALITSGRLVACDTPGRLKRAHGRSGVQVDYLESGALTSQIVDPTTQAGRQTLSELLAHAEVQSVRSLEASLAEVFQQVDGAPAA